MEWFKMRSTCRFSHPSISIHDRARPRHFRDAMPCHTMPCHHVHVHVHFAHHTHIWYQMQRTRSISKCCIHGMGYSLHSTVYHFVAWISLDGSEKKCLKMWMFDAFIHHFRTSQDVTDPKSTPSADVHRGHDEQHLWGANSSDPCEITRRFGS